MKIQKAVIFIALAGLILVGCEELPKSSDTIQQKQQETILAEGTAAIGMPAIKNFRRRRIMKDIQEMLDQNGLVTYTYLENMNPTPIHGHTALGGKLTFFCNSVGYAISAATQFTNPQKIEHPNQGVWFTMPQADPDGLFSPASAEGSWVMCKDPNGTDTKPTYSEPRLVTSPFKLPLD
ncbi:MAG: hypothetical protein ABL917_02130 [Parcubacteria group bacterium]